MAGQKLFTTCDVPGNGLVILIFFHVLTFMLKTGGFNIRSNNLRDLIDKGLAVHDDIL